MKSMKNDGGPAFPSGDGKFGGGPQHDRGMTLRDWFAGQALKAIYSTIEPGQLRIDVSVFAADANTAYSLADAMIAEREK